MTSVNWENVLQNVEMPTEGFDPIPAGTYQVEIVKSVLTNASTTNNDGTKKDMFKIQYRVIEGEYTNRRLFSNQTVSKDSPKAMGIFIKWLNNLGFSMEYL